VTSRYKQKKLSVDISDFFIFRLDDFETIFIAENNLALLTGEMVACKHMFHFFNALGDLCGNFDIKSNDFYFNLTINKDITGNEVIGGFTHHVEYSEQVLCQYGSLMKDISFQHRGYTGYKKKNDKGYSYVHGNFGGIYFDINGKIKSLAKTRGKHIYTPQFIVKLNFDYEFVINNPTKNKAYIRFLLTTTDSVKEISFNSIAPFSTQKFTFNQLCTSYECNISWETNFPLGRCVVFEYGKGNFDVFHS
jgi:hypothetical protein